MSINRAATVGSVLALLLATSGMTTPPAPRMFPTFAMFRGGDLEKPVLMYHANVTTDTIGRIVAANLENDPLAILYQTLVAANRVPPDIPGILTTYEVAEFFGPKWAALAGPDGKPTRALEFEEANHFSNIYVMRSGPVVWMNPVVAPGGGNYSVMIVSDTALAILSRLGLKLH